eukprot:1178308-Prorocentrum_minimum.AAC.2
MASPLPRAGWQSPLWRAAAYGHTAMAEALLAAGASVNLQDKNGAGAPALELISARASAPLLSWRFMLAPAASSASAVAVCPYAAARHRGDQPARAAAATADWSPIITTRAVSFPAVNTRRTRSSAQVTG